LQWSHGQRHATDLIDEACRFRQVQGPDRAFLQDLVLSTLRHLSLLDHWIAQLCPNPKLDHRTRWLLRLGLCQLLILRVAQHAAVNETVNAAGPARALVNAVLRRALREETSTLSRREDLPAWVAHSHPQWLVERWIGDLGPEQALALCQWNQQPPPLFLRLNRLRPEAIANLPDLTDLQPWPKCRDFFTAQRPPLAALEQGWCYIQDPSTAMAATMLAVQPHHRVLDACAAPGGKSLMLAQQLGPEGGLVACDASAQRLQRLRANLERCGAKGVQVLEQDFLKPLRSELQGCQFDRILLDVPCSNSGVMRRRVDVRWRLTAADFDLLCQTQRGLLRAALPLLRPGGILVYSTCSIDAQENEQQIEAALKEMPQLQCIESRRLLPAQDDCDGAFAAALQFIP
jgi:16S rRNA (cytosine967-C5)-methyltransferase